MEAGLMTELRYVFFDLGDVACRFRPQRQLAALAAAPTYNHR